MYGSKAVFSVMRDFTGVVVIDLDFERIRGIIRDIHVGDRGYAFLVDQKGCVVAHPHYAPYALNRETAEDPGLQALITKMITGKRGWERYFFEGEAKIAAFAPIAPMDGPLPSRRPPVNSRKRPGPFRRGSSRWRD